MSLNDKPQGERLHITFYGQRSAGKSSIVHAVTGQEIPLAPESATTVPVNKAAELPSVGPVVLTDTPGIDDRVDLGVQRIRQAMQTLDKTDVAVLVADASRGLQPDDKRLIALFQEKHIPYVTAYNKSDLLTEPPQPTAENSVFVSALQGTNILELKERIAALARRSTPARKIVADLLRPGDLVILVIPIDVSAPKGSLVLPQQQTIREILDSGCSSLVIRETALKSTLEKLKDPPAMVITNPQIFALVDRDLPKTVSLTSFSVLFARYKGNLRELVRGAIHLNALKDGDHVLISEGCTQNHPCSMASLDQLPCWIRAYTKKQLDFSFTAGQDFPEDLSPYALVIHCGACMLTEREMGIRIQRAVEQHVPITNYGMAIAHLHGILRRALSPFPELMEK